MKKYYVIIMLLLCGLCVSACTKISDMDNAAESIVNVGKKRFARA